MRVFGAEEILKLAPMAQLIERLRSAFCAQCATPPRQTVSLPGGAGDRVLMCMPAFDVDGGGVVKLVTIFPDNRESAQPTVQAALLVFSSSGAPVALLDGTMVTKLRTGAASALASSYLSRNDSSHLLIIGSGALAPYMALAHCAIRRIERISVAARRTERAKATAEHIRALLENRMDVEIVVSLEDAVSTADIISCATNSATPVLRGEWLQPGVFVDLVGSAFPDRREADDAVMERSRIFVDTKEGALCEAGDVIDPMKRGAITKESIAGTLADLVVGQVRGRRREDEIIVFKSVGIALEDLAAARLIVEAASQLGNPV